MLLIGALAASNAEAVNCCEPPALRLAVAGEIVTEATGATGVSVQACVAVLVLRGSGAPVVKSADRSPVQVHPASLRSAAVVFVRVAVVLAVPQDVAAVPKLTASSTEVVGQVPDAAVVFETRMTLPAPAAMGMPPIASGVGSGGTAPEPAASCTR